MLTDSAERHGMHKPTGTTEERAKAILEELLRTGSVTVEGLTGRLGVSVATIRRDLTALEREGRLRRTHGGAISLGPLLYEPFRDDSTFQEQIERHADEKRRIGLAAAELVGDGETIGLTAGTTATQVARSIRSRGITLVTNTVNVAMELTQRKDITVFVTGGVLHGGWFSLVGPAAMEAMGQIFLDRLFIGVNGIDAERGLTAAHADEAAINRVMVRQARQKIAVLDHSKLGVVATHRFAGIEELDLLITDTGAEEAALAPYRAAGVEIRLV
ncbi:MAG TPA: DeoR/GlpR family DNA-binding transcription regulator [Bryobacteraceae bacterium]|nr:DeoR/GlpR family DNA-binding transcription regulator [Bryobacteraceae bacterium]